MSKRSSATVSCRVWPGPVTCQTAPKTLTRSGQAMTDVRPLPTFDCKTLYLHRRFASIIYKGVGNLYSGASGPSAQPHRRHHPKSLSHPAYPGLLTEGTPSLHTQAQRLEFRRRVWPVDPCHPVSRSLDWPDAQPRRQFRIALGPRHKLPHRQSSARLTSLARIALRSTYRATVRKCSSV